jgi:hypothetical protein
MMVVYVTTDVGSLAMQNRLVCADSVNLPGDFALMTRQSAIKFRQQYAW